MYDQVSGYRRSLVNFVASVVLGGLAISFLSTITYTIATGSPVGPSVEGIAALSVIFLVLSGYMYMRSQNSPLAQNDSWDFALTVRLDGSTDPSWLTSSSTYQTARFYAPFAYAQLLKTNPQEKNNFFDMPESAFPLPSSSIGFTQPVGDRAGANKSEKFVEELMDYLILQWVAGLQSDYVTVGGKLVQRIELFRTPKRQTFSPEQLQTGADVNRFVRCMVSTSRLEIKLPANMSVSVVRSPGVLPEFVLTTRFIEIRLTYSTYQVRQMKTQLDARVRLFYRAFPKRTMWIPSVRSLLTRENRFPSDDHYKSVDVIHEDLGKFFPSASPS